MAELTTTDPTPTSSCCSTEVQATCCEPSDKAERCGASASGGSCGCSAGQATAEPAVDIGETVREMEQWTGCIAGALTAAEFRGPHRRWARRCRGATHPPSP